LLHVYSALLLTILKKRFTPDPENEEKFEGVGDYFRTGRIKGLVEQIPDVLRLSV